MANSLEIKTGKAEFILQILTWSFSSKAACVLDPRIPSKKDTASATWK